jgi:lauroyl/myristoyl acyltransferase
MTGPATAGSGGGVSDRERHLESPHRRRPRSFSRATERVAVTAYRGTAAVLGHAPERPARALIGRLSQASYLAWPTKRRWSDLNYARVLGREPSDPAVRRLALRAYRTYGRYLVELMRLPSRPLGEVAAMLEAEGIEDLRETWQRSGRGLIVTVPHVGNNEAAAAGLASRGLPISGLADDSSFPELLELLTQQRSVWGIRTIYWKNIREIFGVLRRKEILVLLIDWGYRPDGIPVRLFGHWTTLPAGPATLAAKAKVPILPVAVRRRDDGRYVLTHEALIEVPSSTPADLARGTQQVADALERAISVAPEQWYSFKPMWPATEAEAASLEARATEMLGGAAGPGGTTDAAAADA